MPKKIILIRHGETDHTKKGLAQGWLDVPLNKKGIEQAKKLAKRFKDEAVDVIYSSDLKRAHQTAKLLSKVKRLKTIRTSKIREWNMGTWAGETWDKIGKEYAHIFDEVGNIKDYDWKGHQGESINEFTRRLKLFLEELFEKHPNQTVAIVTHGGTKSRLLDLLKVVSAGTHHAFEHTAVTILKKTKQGNYTLKVFKDTSHLGE